MVQSNKILTVSYGTFSCTLEGFDDAFGTMKAIAEYFRDLAAEDRYFGAEPPQPDAEMLAHIAQKEIARRVEAHRDETGFVLRAEDAVSTAPVLPVTPDHGVAADDAAEVVDTATPAPHTIDTSDEHVVEADPTSIADKAGKDDAALLDTADADVAEMTASAATILAEEAPVPVETPETDDMMTAEYAPDTSDVPEETADMGDDIAAHEDAPLPPAHDEQDEQEIAAVESTPEEAPSVADSIAAKLQRIRAVVSRSTAKPADQEYSEDEHAEALDVPAPVEETQPDTEGEASRYDDALQAEIDELDARLDALDPAEDIAEDPADMDDVTDDEDDPVAEALPDPDVEAEPRMQARVVKVTRAEFDALLAADREEAEADAQATPDGSLSEEDEADLLRELAEVEAEFAAEDDLSSDAIEEIEEADIAETLSDEEMEGTDEDIAAILEEDASEEIEPATTAAEEEPSILAEKVDADASVERLMDEADSKLEDEVTSTRRSEFAHLRAAMAAGKAEEAAGGSMSPDTSEQDYREDLARVVRPRRPDAGENRVRSRRPQDEKPAPLKLVAAQRIDAEPAPVQPRRVMSKPVEPVSEDTSDGVMKFADYAEGVGAHDLPDLLEAAAAYLSFVEGQKQFSRPQLMTKVRMVEQEDFSREDGLRSFGLLLRDGKIEKTQAGRFTVSDRIGFRPEDMRAAG